MKTKILILYVYGLSAAACFMMYFAPADPAAGGIPDEAIRIRVVAHDNSREEQERKELVHKAVAAQIGKWASKARSPEEARLLIEENIKDIKDNASQAADENVQVSLGEEAFPAKQYGRYIYPPGEYESLVITIGDGRGDNWWCLLYPAFCFPEEEEEEKLEYKWAVVELWEKLQSEDPIKLKGEAIVRKNDIDSSFTAVVKNIQSSTWLCTEVDKLYTYCE